MIEQTNGITNPDLNGSNSHAPMQDSSWTLGPREFILKYLVYLPWLLICVALSLIFAYIKIRYSTPIYKVQSSLLVKSDPAGKGGDDKFATLYSQSGPNLSNEIPILLSSPVIRRVVRDLDFQVNYYGMGKIRSTLLYPTSPFQMNILHIEDSSRGFSISLTLLNNDQFLISPSKKPTSFGDIIEMGGNRFTLTRNKEIDPSGFTSNIFRITWQPDSQVAGGIMRGLKIVQTNEQSNILTLSYNGESANLGRDVLNVLMAVYDSLVVEDKQRISVNTLNFIDYTLDTLQRELGGAEGSLKGYMLKNDAIDITAQTNSYFQNITETSRQLEQLDLKIKIADILLDYIKTDKNTYMQVPTNLGVEEPVYSRLVAEYNTLQMSREANLKTTSPDNPLIRNINNNLVKVRHDMIEALNSVKNAYMVTQSSLNRQNEDFHGRLRSLPGKTIGLSNIQRKQKILEDLYSFLLQKKFETAISSASTVSNSKILEPASASGEPISPDKKSIYSLYVIFGLTIPIAIVALFELFRDKIGNRVDVEKRTHAPIIGEIGHSDDSQALVVKKNSRRFISEQFRIIRSNLQYIIAKKEKPIIMVTSSFSGEGKSFISTNIGAVMSLAGKKTVIMEFDIRKPKIVSSLELKRKMGITNYIIGRAKFNELILPVEGMENLFVIPCGPIPPNPSELLLDKRLNDLMREAHEHFEVIIMDTAPVGLVSDAINLGRFADCTLYIVRQGFTFRKQLRFIEELYQEKKLPSISLLLNDVKAEGGYYSGYYGGYYSGYSYGFESGYFEAEPTKRKNQSVVKQTKRWLKRWFT